MGHTEKFIWSRYGGYECSTRGDRRFSAFTALLHDGRTIEQHYQCDIKGYQSGGRNWRLGKGKPPIRQTDLWEEYLSLWRTWSSANMPLMRELYTNAKRYNNTLSDRFATSEINQAHALATILNELLEKGK